MSTPQVELLARVRERSGNVKRVQVQTAGNHVDLLVGREERHAWSPWLSVAIEQAAGGSRIRGRFGPHPSVWTLFMSIQMFLSFLALCALVGGAALWTLGHSPWPFFALPVVLALMVATYLGSQIGQRLGEDQMHVLHDALDQLVGHPTRERVETLPG